MLSDISDGGAVNAPMGCGSETRLGYTIWFTGLSGAGKSTLSRMLEQRIRATGSKVELLDGDVVRTHLSKGLGFSREDRDENIRRIGFICELLTRNGVTTVAAAISPYRAVRESLRRRIGNFIEVYVTCPIDVLIARDVKGLYKRALTGQIPCFTGISDPYETPLNPEVTVDSSIESPTQSLDKIWEVLQRTGGFLSTRTVQQVVDSSPSTSEGQIPQDLLSTSWESHL